MQMLLPQSIQVSCYSHESCGIHEGSFYVKIRSRVHLLQGQVLHTNSKKTLVGSVKGKE